MPYEADDYLSRHVQTSEVDLTRKVDELVALAAPATARTCSCTGKCSVP